MRLEWSEPALEDLRNLQTYIAKDSPHYARLFIERLLSAPESLVEFPESGRQVPETGLASIRELIVQGSASFIRSVPATASWSWLLSMAGGA